MKKINKLNLAVAAILLCVIFATSFAKAQFDGEISEEDKATFDKILEPVMKIYNLVKYAATFIAALVLLLAGISYMTSGSDPIKRDKAKNMAMYVVIGLVVIWAAPIVVQFILK